MLLKTMLSTFQKIHVENNPFFFNPKISASNMDTEQRCTNTMDSLLHTHSYHLIDEYFWTCGRTESGASTFLHRYLLPLLTSYTKLLRLIGIGVGRTVLWWVPLRAGSST